MEIRENDVTRDFVLSGHMTMILKSPSFSEEDRLASVRSRNCDIVERYLHIHGRDPDDYNYGGKLEPEGEGFEIFAIHIENADHSLDWKGDADLKLSLQFKCTRRIAILDKLEPVDTNVLVDSVYDEMKAACVQFALRTEQTVLDNSPVLDVISCDIEYDPVS